MADAWQFHQQKLWTDGFHEICRSDKNPPVRKDRTKGKFPPFSPWQTCKIHPNPLSHGPIGKPGSPRAPEFQPFFAAATLGAGVPPELLEDPSRRGKYDQYQVWQLRSTAAGDLHGSRHLARRNCSTKPLGQKKTKKVSTIFGLDRETSENDVDQ